MNNKKELAKFLELCSHLVYPRLTSEYYYNVLVAYEKDFEGKTMLKDKSD